MRTYRWVRWLAAVLAVTVLAAGCGPGGGDAGEGGRHKVPVGVTSLNSLHLWLIVARDEKLMEPYGVDLDIVTFQNTGQITPALLSGSVNFGMAAPEQVFSAQEEEPGLKMVAAEITNNPYSMIVSPEIKSLKDIKGKTIGVTGMGASADYFTAKLLLQAHGLEEKRDYNFTNAGPPPQRATALLENQIDAVMSFEPDAQKLVDKGMKSIAAASDQPNLHDVLMGSIIANKEWYDENREVAVDFMRGYLASVKWLYDPKNKDKAVADIAAEMNVSEKAAAATYDQFVTTLKASPLDGRIDHAFLERTVENIKKEGLKNAPPPGELKSKYDNSLVDAAAKGKG
ncbi:MAG: PhnD/SsuA/transferrin family substrate-binding protein [Streptosporangiales bacterium]|nr:PhnD/SsuA/transferrin family substrate-binding protein [Streptosporangiales bacterium]